MSNIVFHRVSGSKKKDKSMDVDDKYISLQNRREGAMIVNFKGPEEKIMEIYHFFRCPGGYGNCTCGHR
ncbi:hypothetical protein [Methanobacterium petrolearium]|uniref:hypothetical protein n=1 Tax=Methanobacterium petrolearium TaxID=710190 RepID=UPI001FD78D2D|nr:hypothetical protein [Methanobacterium petrolearium]MBP1945023.1 hypothetical protein [Methanobacterium petrolearium]BDZ70349.1 hypothetical protein GCM10025861_08660 [Methanobacterium petrolearium]